MRCELCGKARAVYALEDRQGQQVRRQHLCKSCARESQKTRLGNGMEFVLSDLLPERDGYNDHDRVRVCANCQTTAQEFAESEKPGCPDCYVIFADEISVLLKKQQGHAEHLGKKIYRSEGSSV